MKVLFFVQIVEILAGYYFYCY